MTNLEEIHSSLIEADDLEEVHKAIISTGEVLVSLVRHPMQMLTRWNWKAALVGALIRAFFYLTVYKTSKENWIVTLTAVAVELSFRFFTSGISGSITQSFRRAQPQWLSVVVVSTTLPIFGHLVEYITHFAQENYFANVFAASENNGRQRAFAISVLISILSSLFNLFAMRDGVLLVGAGEEQQTLWQDLKRIPALLLEFMIYIPVKIINNLKTMNVLTAFGYFLAFGLSIGAILGIFRGKWQWAWTTAVGAWAIMLVWTILVAIGINIQSRRAANQESEA